MLFLTFQIGDQRLALDVRRVREVVPRVPLRRPSLAPEWLAGMFVYRGAVVPVVDLHRLKRAGECPLHLSSRIILVSRSADLEQSLIGLLAAQVVSVQEIDLSLAGSMIGQTTADSGGILHIVDLDRLLPSAEQLNLQCLLEGRA